MRLVEKPQKNLTPWKLLDCSIIAFVFWYVLLCVVNLFYQRPLWNDEECVFHSIKSFTVREIFTRGLLDVQVFPRAYLFLIQQLAKPFDFHLIALRFLPFVCMLLGFFLWLKVAAREFKNKFEYLTFVVSWSASAVLIYYSGELKQYSMDVLAGSIFLLFIYAWKENEDKGKKTSYPFLAAFLPFLGVFSYPAFLFSIIVFYNLTMSAREDKKYLSLAVFYLVSLCTVMAFSYLFDMRYRHAETVTKGFGDYFVSLNSLPDFLKTWGEGTNNLFSRWFVERPKIFKKIGLFFVSFGFVYLFASFFKNFKKERYRLNSLSTIAFALYAGLFILGALKKYPFTVPRTSLFFCPVVLYATIKGIVSLKDWNVYLYRMIHALYFLFLFFLTIALSRITLAGNLTFRPVLW